MNVVFKLIVELLSEPSHLAVLRGHVTLQQVLGGVHRQLLVGSPPGIIAQVLVSVSVSLLVQVTVLLSLFMEMVVFVTVNMSVGVLMVRDMGVTPGVIIGMTIGEKIFEKKKFLGADIIVRTGSTFKKLMFPINYIFDDPTCVDARVYAWIYVYENDHAAAECSLLETYLCPDPPTMMIELRTLWVILMMS